MDKQDAEYKKLRWRTRRGMLELDLLLAPFFDDFYLDLTGEQQQAFVALLEQEDPDLLAWFNGNDRPPDAGLGNIVDLILARVRPAR